MKLVDGDVPIEQRSGRKHAKGIGLERDGQDGLADGGWGRVGITEPVLFSHELYMPFTIHPKPAQTHFRSLQDSQIQYARHALFFRYVDVQYINV
jgi:hypothetical protein